MIRSHHISGDKQEELKWWGWLSPTKQNDLKQLVQIDQLMRGFDLCVDLEGLWEPIMLGTHRFPITKFDDV